MKRRNSWKGIFSNPEAYDADLVRKSYNPESPLAKWSNNVTGEEAIRMMDDVHKMFNLGKWKKKSR